ncbi:3336_t:CDS:2, partial [Gigaspora margarita]
MNDVFFSGTYDDSDYNEFTNNNGTVINMHNNFNGQCNEYNDEFMNDYKFSIDVHNNFNGQYNKDYDMNVNEISMDKFNNFNMKYSKDYDESMNDNGTLTDVVNNFNIEYINEERVIEENQSSMESENEDAESTYSLIENHVFKSWEEVDIENDKTDKKPRHHVYSCTKGQKYVQRKEAHVVDERNKGHKT